MAEAANLVEVAALVGDTARATMLAALMGGRALTAGELAGLARIGKSTALEHLARLAGANLVAATNGGVSATTGSPPRASPRCWGA